MSTTAKPSKDTTTGARVGKVDMKLEVDWPSWYAAYMVAEQSGAELPT